MNHHHHYLKHPSMNFQQLPHLFQQEIPIKMEDARCAQMTIFYDGKVIVLDDITPEKAKDIMVFSTNNYAAYPSFLAGNSANKTVQVPSTVPVIYDLPMTRKASLHRFLEKRRNRIAARAPYQITYPAATINKTIDESMAWLSLTPQSPQHKSECSSTSVLF
ncbi:protein TIFY 10a [Trifolium repens]|nr:protein TIFY 10a [Trifolium repens]